MPRLPRPPKARAIPVVATADRMIALYRAGDEAAAEAACAQVLAVAPTHHAALVMQGVFHAKRGDYPLAIEHFDRAILQEPARASAYGNRGHALSALGRYHDAVASYDRAIALGLEHAHNQTHRGNALARIGRTDRALQAYDRAIVLDPAYANARFARADLLLDLDRRAEAVAELEAARAAGADPQRVDFALAALGLAPPMPAAPEDYVRTLFDGYADDFDAHLVQHLQYRAPQLVAQRLGTLPMQPQDTVDLGCGTGLAGAALRPHARRLTGVDLSPKMLERAGRRGLYDELVCAELVAFLQSRPAAFGLAVAADVFNYFGDLAPILAAAQGALQPQGLLVFTLEASVGGDVVLNRTRRFAHTRVHVEQRAAEHGFVPLSIEPEVLRQEGRGEVGGWLVALQRI